MKPSEYFRRNVFLGASCMPRREVELRHEIGVGNIMWGSDYPHPEGTWPRTRQHMEEAFAVYRRRNWARCWAATRRASTGSIPTSWLHWPLASVPRNDRSNRINRRGIQSAGWNPIHELVVPPEARGLVAARIGFVGKG